jgi:hypothetical protein
MGRQVKHIQLHRIGATELRVISDVDAGVLPVVQQEETVIRGFMQYGGWPHHHVSLFILKDLQPLAQQLRGGALPSGGADALNTRTVVNLFDLANPRACHVYVNQQAMIKASYWDDPLAIQGLLAHEHAHPLAENTSSRASRALTIEPGFSDEPPAVGPPQQQRLIAIIARLLEQLCLYAPREIFTNERAIAGGFDQAMLHLNRRNVANACQSVAGRRQLHELLQQDVAQGKRSAQEIGLLMLLGDLESHLKLAMEVAPFERAGRASYAQELDQVLEHGLFPQLEPQVAPSYAAIRRLYSDLRGDLAVSELQAWAQGVAAIVLAALETQGLHVRCQVRPAT